MIEQITISRKDAEWIKDLVSSLIDTATCEHDKGICFCEDWAIMTMLDDKLNGRTE
jgi:hypothetical protein